MAVYSISIAELQHALGLPIDGQFMPLKPLTHLTVDSRTASEGSIFFAYPGETVDGRSFIASAVANGATVVVCDSSDEGKEEFRLSAGDVPILFVEDLQQKVGLVADRFYQSPSAELQVFGVTGTNGKTTCCFLLTQALMEMGLNVAMIGTIGAGSLMSISYNGLTTPGPIEVHRLLANWRDSGVTQVCMEVSSHALDQGRVSGVKFYGTSFTNLSHDHLDYHGTMEVYGAAKAKLFTDYRSELSMINVDDAMGRDLVDLSTSEFVVAYGDGGDVQVGEWSIGENGLSLYIEANGVDFEVVTPLIGKINVPNILLLVATLLSLSVPVEKIQEICSSLKPAPGRMELYQANSGAKVVVDFAHTPDALEKALQSVQEHCEGRLWCVFGCGGDRDKVKRPVMGMAAAKFSDNIIITNDNPRSEKPESIAQDIRKGISTSPEGKASNTDVRVILDRAEAIETAIELAGPQDWILIAGRGHEHLQQIGSDFLPFSDRDHVSQIVSGVQS